MKSSFSVLLLSAAFACPSLAAAQSVSEADAKAIEGRFLTVLGKDLADTGALAVRAVGDRYEVTFDIRKALEKNIAPWTVKAANSILHSLRPAATGFWDYSGRGEIHLATELAAANRSSSVTLNIGSFENKGVFDQALRFVRNGEFKSGDLAFVMRSAQDSLKIAAKDYSFKIGFTEEKPGLGDISTDVAAHEISETFGTFPNPETKLAGGTLTGHFLFEDVDFNGIGKLVDFWSGSAKGKSIDTMTDAERTALSEIVRDHAPFIKQLGESTSVDGVSVTWGGNAVKIENLAYRWAVEDIGGDAAAVMGVRVKNPTVDVSALPASLKKMLPHDAGLGLRYSGIKLSAMWEALADPKMARQALETKDFYTRKIFPNGRVRVDFDDTYFRSDYYDISVSGGMDVPLDNPRKPDRADVLVTARDFDKTIKSLQDLSREDPIFNQVSISAMMMKGFGKVQADGSMLWRIEADASGSVTVNGQPMPH